MITTTASAISETAAAMITPESGWFRLRGTDATPERAIRYTGTNRDQVHEFLNLPMGYHPEVSGLVLHGVSVKPGSWVVATPISGPDIRGHAGFDATYERVTRPL